MSFFSQCRHLELHLLNTRVVR